MYVYINFIISQAKQDLQAYKDAEKAAEQKTQKGMDLQRAFLHQDFEVVAQMVEDIHPSIMDLTVLDPAGMSLLHLAARAVQPDVVVKLLEHAPELVEQTTFMTREPAGWFPIMCCADNGYVKDNPAWVKAFTTCMSSLFRAMDGRTSAPRAILDHRTKTGQTVSIIHYKL